MVESGGPSSRLPPDSRARSIPPSQPCGFLNVLVAFEYGGALLETVIGSLSEAVFKGGSDEGMRAVPAVCLTPEFALRE